MHLNTWHVVVADESPGVGVICASVKHVIIVSVAHSAPVPHLHSSLPADEVSHLELFVSHFIVPATLQTQAGVDPDVSQVGFKASHPL